MLVFVVGPILVRCIQLEFKTLNLYSEPGWGKRVVSWSLIFAKKSFFFHLLESVGFLSSVNKAAYPFDKEKSFMERCGAVLRKFHA